jgi:hypothetical protein
VQSSATCAVCGNPTVWSVLRVPPPGEAPIAPIYSTPMPLPSSSHQPSPRPAGAATRTCVNPSCDHYHLVQDDERCAGCGYATVAATTL